jgi:hypothetical protein
MHDAARYCAIRSKLEDHAYNLSAELVGLIQRLHSLVGKNHREFLATRTSCIKVREQISESHNQLEAHRTTHGC